MKRKYTWIWIVVGLAILVALVIREKNRRANKGEKVTAEKVMRRTIIQTVTASGKIYPISEVKISPDISGEVTMLKVAEGDSVKKGQLLATVYNNVYSASRDQTAPIDGLVTSINIRKGEKVVGTAQQAGTEIMTVADMSAFEIRVNVGENDIVRVKVGDSTDIRIDAYNRRKFVGVVTQIAGSPAGRNSSLFGGAASGTNDVTSYEVRIRIDKSSYQDLLDPANPKRFPFRSGMNASAEIKTQRMENILTIPINAVSARTKESGLSTAERKKEMENQDNQQLDAAYTEEEVMEEVVFVLQPDKKVKKVLVQTGIQDLNYIEIKSGLAGGEEVITNPYTAVTQTLKDGTKVTVVTKEELFKK